MKTSKARKILESNPALAEQLAAALSHSAFETALGIACEGLDEADRPTVEQFQTWLCEPHDDGYSRFVMYAREFLEAREAPDEPEVGSDDGSIPVGDEQGEVQDDEGPEREFLVTTVESWTVVVDYRVDATSKQDAKDQVEEGSCEYNNTEVLNWEVTKFSEVVEV